jgi:hypothetical protein
LESVPFHGVSIWKEWRQILVEMLFVRHQLCNCLVGRYA